MLCSPSLYSVVNMERMEGVAFDCAVASVQKLKTIFV